MIHKTTKESFWEEHTDNSGVKETFDTPGIVTGKQIGRAHV